MSNYAAVRDRIMGQYDRGTVPLQVAQGLFDLSWAAVGQDEGRAEHDYVGRIADYRRAQSAVGVASFTTPPPALPPAPPPTTPMLKLDAAALAVIADALGNGTMFDNAARAQVLRELVAEMRRADIQVGVKA
jgi:hypothetical protein